MDAKNPKRLNFFIIIISIPLYVFTEGHGSPPE